MNFEKRLVWFQIVKRLIRIRKWFQIRPSQKIRLVCHYVKDRLHKWRRTVPAGGAGPGPDGSEQVERTLPNPMGRQHIAPHIKVGWRRLNDIG